MVLKFNRPVDQTPANADGHFEDGKQNINSKYHLRHISQFYEITQAMVLDQQHNPVGLADQQVMVAFSKLIIRVMQGPDLYYGVIGKTYRHGEHISIYPVGHQCNLELSADFKRKLLHWMAEVVLIKHQTLEDLLDAYFAVFPLINPPSIS